MEFRMAAQGSNAQRQDGAGRVWVDAGRHRPGDPCWNAPLPRRLDARKPLAAASPARGGSASPEEARDELPEGSAVEGGTCAHQWRTEATKDPDCSVGGEEVQVDCRHQEVKASVPSSNKEPRRMRGYFAAGFDIGISTAKLAQAMVEVLSQLPPEATPSKKVVVRHLGLLGQIAKTRDVNAAWNRAERQVVREQPDRFCLDGKVLRWATALENRSREKLSTAGHRKLTILAAKEGITPDELLSRLIFSWRRAKR